MRPLSSFPSMLPRPNHPGNHFSVKPDVEGFLVFLLLFSFSFIAISNSSELSPLPPPPPPVHTPFRRVFHCCLAINLIVVCCYLSLRLSHGQDGQWVKDPPCERRLELFDRYSKRTRRINPWIFLANPRRSPQLRPF